MRESLHRRLRAVRLDERGLTLIELLVSMALFTGLLTAVYGVLINVQRQSVDVQARENSVGNARLALEQMDRQIRSGNVFFDPNDATDSDYLPMSLRVYTQANGDERCVQWQVLAGTLRTRAWSTTWQTDGNITPWSNVARGLVNTSSPFVLQGGSTPYGSRLLDITLLVKDPKSKGQPVEVRTSLSGRNTQYGYDPGTCRPAPPVGAS